MTDALKELIAAVEAGDVMDWGYAQGYPRIALGDNWELGLKAYGGSLDAAKALHESMLPRWRWTITRDGICTVVSDKFKDSKGLTYRYIRMKSQHFITSRAWLLSILKAKLAEEEK